MKIQKTFVFFFLGVLFFYSKFAFGQPNLTDFESRAYQKGFQCIPYEKFRYWVDDLEKEKNEKQEIVTRKYNYDSLSIQKNNLIKEFNGREKEIKIKIKEIDDWKKENPLRDAKSLEDILAAYKSKQSENENKIDSLNQIIESGVNAWKEFADASGKILNRYEQIDTKLAGETAGNVLGDSYTSDEESRLNRAISSIRDEIKNIEKANRDQENDARKTEQDMSELLKQNIRVE